MKSCKNEFKIILQCKYHHWIFQSVLHEFWQIVDYELRLHHCAEKEENFDNLCCESAQPTVENHEYGSQDSNNVETKMNLHACIGKPFPSRCGWNPASSKSSSGSRQRRQQQSHVNTSEKVKLQKRKRILRADKIRTTIPGWRTSRKHSFEILLFKYVYSDTMIDVTVKQWEQRVVMLYFQYWKRRSVQNPKIIGKRIHVWGLVALPLPQKLQICKFGVFRAIRRPYADWITQRFLTRVQFIYPVDWARDHYSITEAGLGSKRKERKEDVGDVHTRTEGRQTFPLQWLWSVQFVSTTMPAKQK